MTTPAEGAPAAPASTPAPVPSPEHTDTTSPTAAEAPTFVSAADVAPRVEAAATGLEAPWALAWDTDSLARKVLCMNPDGSVPEDKPFELSRQHLHRLVLGREDGLTVVGEERLFPGGVRSPAGGGDGARWAPPCQHQQPRRTRAPRPRG